MRIIIGAIVLLGACSDERAISGDQTASPLEAAKRICSGKSKGASTWERSDHDQCLAAEANKVIPVDESICRTAKGDMIKGKCALLIL